MTICFICAVEPPLPRHTVCAKHHAPLVCHICERASLERATELAAKRAAERKAKMRRAKK